MAPQTTDRAAELAAILGRACELDVLAFKPGNVSVTSPGHGMTAQDFFASARVVVAPLTAPHGKIGERILAAIAATQAAVNCNTNLGIVLLAAPMLHAWLGARVGDSPRARLQSELAALTVEDARLMYEAIRIAKPGGMGTSARHDLRDEPQITALAAMQEAADRDGIARQYATGYRDVFDIGAPRYRAGVAAWSSEEWAVTATFLALLAHLPDSLITRKHGADAARRVSETAAGLSAKIDRVSHPRVLAAELQRWDRELKRAGLNPGTTADLTVASVLAARSEELLQRSGSIPDRAGSKQGERTTAQAFKPTRQET